MTYTRPVTPSRHKASEFIQNILQSLPGYKAHRSSATGYVSMKDPQKFRATKSKACEKSIHSRLCASSLFTSFLRVITSGPIEGQKNESFYVWRPSS